MQGSDTNVRWWIGCQDRKAAFNSSPLHKLLIIRKLRANDGNKCLDLYIHLFILLCFFKFLTTWSKLSQVKERVERFCLQQNIFDGIGCIGSILIRYMNLILQEGPYSQYPRKRNKKFWCEIFQNYFWK